MRAKYLTLLPMLAVCLAGMSAAAADSTSSPTKYKWVEGPTTVNLKQIARIELPAGYIFTGPEDTRKILEKMGNPTSGRELGFLAPTSTVWFVIFEFSEVGYVKDDEKAKLDGDKILQSIRTGNERANAWRKQRGSPPLTIVGWEQAPRYNEATHNLEWAIRGESEGRPVVNYNTRLLGRKGVMEVSLVVDPEKMAATLPTYQQLLTGYSFQTGERYAEYRSGDKLAKYGLTALIAGGAAAVAVKTGLFASLVLFFKKGAKLLVLAIVALAAYLKRFFFGADRSKSQSP